MIQSSVEYIWGLVLVSIRQASELSMLRHVSIASKRNVIK